MGKRKYQKASRHTEEEYDPVANPKAAAGMHEIARSNKAGIHDSRPHRQRDRTTQRRAAIRDQTA